ncbi:MAG: TadE/TadG family type IV pilus assembly protein, partial [Chloroflexota bacterium]
MFHVNSSRPFARQHKGQALVEFSLTLMVFLLLLFLIIEVARILQAYVTVQHAARLAARYATTGHWESEYGIDPLAGWSYPTSNPMEAIRPCWPAFPDDPILAGTPQQIPAGKDFYQPFRNARTCSIEATAVRGMTGLALDPAASPNSPNYYQIVVWGAGNGVDFTDTFERNGVSGIPYSNYGYNASEPEFWAYRGFGGDPQQKVIVKIEYWVRINTPILNDIAPAVRVEGTAIMTNEAFGSTGLQREAIVAPELPPVDTSLAQPSPPDMIVNSITYLGPVSTLDDTDFNLDAEEPARFEFVVKNKGTTDVTSFIPTATDYRVSVYAYPVGTVPSPLSTPLVDSDRILIGQATLSQMLIAGASSAPFQIDVTFPLGTSSGDYTIVAWVDSNYTAGTRENGDILENDILFTNQESNNAREWTGGPIDLNYSSNLDLAVSFWDAALTGEILEADQDDHVVYQVQVTNNGGSAENNVTVTLDAASSGLSGEALEHLEGNDYTAPTWDVGTVNPGQTVTLDLG